MPDTRPIPTREHAAGMLAAIQQGHECGEACTSMIRLGGPFGDLVKLKCPYKVLDLDSETDRRIIGSIYAIEARAAMAGVTR